MCYFVVLSVVEVCADYGGVNVYHACLNVGVVYGVGVCVKFMVYSVLLYVFVSYVWVLFVVLWCSWCVGC